MEEMLRTQQKTIQEQQKMIDRLKEELTTVRKQEAPAPATETGPVEIARAPVSSGISGLFGGSVMTNPYISFVLNGNFYSSSINERDLASRGIPGYSNLGFDQKKGFNISEGELFLFAPCRPPISISTRTYRSLRMGHLWKKRTSSPPRCPKGSRSRGGQVQEQFQPIQRPAPPTPGIFFRCPPSRTGRSSARKG